MSRMSEIAITIEDMLYDGYSATEIQEKLFVPLEWIEEVKEFMSREQEEAITFLLDSEAEANELKITEMESEL